MCRTCAWWQQSRSECTRSCRLDVPYVCLVATVTFIMHTILSTRCAVRVPGGNSHSRTAAAHRVISSKLTRARAKVHFGIKYRFPDFYSSTNIVFNSNTNTLHFCYSNTIYIGGNLACFVVAADVYTVGDNMFS